MSGKLSIYDAFVTVGAFILALGLYQHVKPLVSAYAYAARGNPYGPAPIDYYGPINCDKPYLAQVPAVDKAKFNSLDQDERRKWIKEKERVHQRICNNQRHQLGLSSTTADIDFLNKPTDAGPNFTTREPRSLNDPNNGGVFSEYAYAYDATRTDDPVNVTRVGELGRTYDYKRCLKVAHPKCCQAAQGGGISDDELSNCHLCNHPDCEHFQTIGPGGDPTLPPFQPGTYKVALQDIGYKDSNYAYASDDFEPAPDFYPPIKPTQPEESENDMRSHRWTKKYGCRKVVGPDGKWLNLCTGVGTGEGIRVAPPLYPDQGDADYYLGKTQEQSSAFARAYRVTYY